MGDTNKRRKGKGTGGRDRQRLYMQKLRQNPDKYEEFKKRERERYHANKNKKAELSDRSKRQQKKKWHTAQASSRGRKQEERKRMEQAAMNTPPNSPEDAGPAAPPMDAGPAAPPMDAGHAAPPIENAHGSLQKERGRKKIRRNRSTLSRKVQALEQLLEVQRRSADRFKKRLQRMQMKLPKNTPEKDVNKLRKQGNGGVRKALLFGSAIFRAIKERYSASTSYKEKQFISRLIAMRLRKYRMTGGAQAILGIPRYAMKLIGQDDTGPLCQYRRKMHESARRRLSSTLSKFYCRDDNSRTTTGTRDTVSRCGVKAQRRLLLDSLGRLFKRFKTENPWCSISYSLFCSMMPFFIVSPTNVDRETCLCKTHENSRMIIDKLHQTKHLPQSVSTVDACVDAAVCAEPGRHCYERTCNACKESMKFPESNDLQDTVEWQQWMLVKEDRCIKGKNVVVSRCVKQTHSGTYLELRQKFEVMLPKLCWHIMVMRHQFQQYRDIKEKDTCTMIVDFSENFTCGHNRAIQSSHFGASNKQVTLHTGVAYTHSKTLSFCSVSESTRHDAAAIAAHIDPVIGYVKTENRGLDFINFWSDGPVTQYRNKQHFVTVSHIHEYGLAGCTWNYSEAGHGKGAADSIGGVIKRLANAAEWPSE